MAAYGSLISLTNLIERVREYNVRNTVFNDQQLMQLQSLEEKAVSLQHFLEMYSSGGRREGETLEGQIAVVILDAQDLIESRIAYLIHAQYCDSDVFVEYDSQDCVILSQIYNDIYAKCVTGLKVDTDGYFSQVLQSIIEVVDLIKKEASEIAQNASMSHEQPRHLASIGLHKPTLAGPDKDHAVIFGDILSQLMDKLITIRALDLQTIPITGMGGIGKTTLARTIYDDPRTLKHFDIRIWITVSEEFDEQAILFGLMSEIGGGKELKQLAYHDLGERLHKHLSGRRYLIVLDDVWSEDAWNKIKRYLSDDNTKASRIIVTTRITKFAIKIAPSHNFEMNLLSANDSWSLLKEKVFRNEVCPPEIEEIGKEIAKNCKGLPLSIVVIGGLLATSLDYQYWKSIAEDVNASVNSKVSDHCLKILSASYLHLPIHLKPCFLYFGAFAEDYDIKVSHLMYRWVARGFIKPREGKTLEEIGYDYLKDLVERNLIFVSRFTFMRKMNKCKIHDLLRELCLNEVKEERFFSQRFLRNDSSGEEKYCFPECDYDLSSSSQNDQAHLAKEGYIHNPFLNLKPLRVVKLDAKRVTYDRRCGVNMRYLQKLKVNVMDLKLSWNIQTLIGEDMKLPPEIWYNPQIRHLIGGSDNFTIDDPYIGKRDQEDSIVLKNLQTISLVYDFMVSEDILRKVPNLEKLSIHYSDEGLKTVSSQHLQNLGHFKKLESLTFVSYTFPRKLLRMLEPLSFGSDNLPLELQSKLEFSQSIRKLDLSLEYFEWEEMGKKIGSLPLLQKLTLCYLKGGEEWNSIEGEFPSLTYLFIRDSNLVRWTIDDGGASLPCLEHLVLFYMAKMEEIPAEIGDIESLQSIQVYGGRHWNNTGVIRSAKDILSDQRFNGNESLHLYISRHPGRPKYEIKEDYISDSDPFESDDEEQVESEDEEQIESESEELEDEEQVESESEESEDEDEEE